MLWIPFLSRCCLGKILGIHLCTFFYEYFHTYCLDHWGCFHRSHYIILGAHCNALLFVSTLQPCFLMALSFWPLVDTPLWWWVLGLIHLSDSRLMSIGAPTFTYFECWSSPGYSPWCRGLSCLSQSISTNLTFWCSYFECEWWGAPHCSIYFHSIARAYCWDSSSWSSHEWILELNSLL